ncbi:hypothetical protein SAMN05444673_2553 [Bacillus sp. OV166]|uniref:hypothetical protein n=1 Tax=Bacillus sp. OV166 TaxID=1882763 RepID=UPI000A2AE7F4|nr:hypothetical protein [Bacillus sp. OV166]SMQ75884.1 hypothetical protein SAMN05444673_2553 [Bacillus sp. OV166]
MEEAEWESIEAYYIARLNKEKEKVIDLTEIINKQNKVLEQVNFHIQLLSRTLKTACKEIDRYRELEKAK